jgi:eukaryotic-like serine/threonine-protein kinase
MQYVPGETLQSVMTTRGMNLKRVADPLRKIAQALDTAHEQGVIHRDLKPANIMLQTSNVQTIGLQRRRCPTTQRERTKKIIP